MASSTLSSRMLVMTYLTDASGLSILRHQLLPTPAHDFLYIATASQLYAAILFHLKSLSAHGYHHLFGKNKIGDPVTSLVLTLTLYWFMTVLAFHTKTTTSGTAYALGLAISLVMILETFNTIYAMMMMMRLKFPLELERVRIVSTYTSGPSILLASSSYMGPGSDLSHGHSPEVNSTQKENNAANSQSHKHKRSTAKTKAPLHNEPHSEGSYTLKAGEDTMRQQDNTITHILDAPQHKSSKAQPTTYKSISPYLYTGEKPNMKTSEIYIPPQIPAIQPSESKYQMTQQISMYRSKRPRTLRSRMSTSVNEYPSAFLHPMDLSQMPVLSEDELSEQDPGTSTPSSEDSTSTTESDFQADLRMMLGSACGPRKRGKRVRRSDLSIVKGSDCLSPQETEFQMRFREVMWPACGSRIRAGTPESGNESELGFSG